MKKNRIYPDIIKRFFDIVLCSAAVLVLSPFFLIAAVGIKVSSPGPVFYRSQRKGKNGIPFDFYKFRSMHETENNKHLCVADEERLFPFGRFIRKVKIDELPQLLNIIKGDMSIVGPRPMTLRSQMYTGRFEEVQSTRPGLTSPASLYDYIIGDIYKDNDLYKKEVYPVKQRLELYYVRHESIPYDIGLILRTVRLVCCVVLGKRNAEPLTGKERAALASEEYR